MGKKDFFQRHENWLTVGSMGFVPEISVVMPVYNAEAYLEDALKSILNQTFEEIEILIIDDGSFDKTREILAAYSSRDTRIRVIENEKNLGIAESLNKGIQEAKADIIARMDADDIAFPERLAKQYRFMSLNPDVGVCGSWAEMFGDKQGLLTVPVHDSEIRSRLLFENCILHPTVLLRKSLFSGNGLSFDKHLLYVEDYDLWLRAMKCTKFYNVPEPLLYYRLHRDQVSSSHRETQQKNARKLFWRTVSEITQGQLPSTECLSISLFFPPDLPRNIKDLSCFVHFILMLSRQQTAIERFPLISREGAKYIMNCYSQLLGEGVSVWGSFYREVLWKNFVPLRVKIRFILRVLYRAVKEMLLVSLGKKRKR